MAHIPPRLDLPALVERLRRDRLVLRRPRENRREMVRQFVGQRWSEDGTDRPVPVNLIALYVGVILTHLIAKEPRFTASTDDPEGRAAVEVLERWGNRELVRQQATQTLQRIVLDSLF